MALDFMMPPQGVPGELPPGMPPAAVATPVPMPMPPQAQPLPQSAPAQDPMAQAVQAAQPQVAQEEGAEGQGAGGMGFFDKLRTDPKLSQAMMMVGLRMMQGQRPGQDAFGMVSDAMMAGATAHNMLSHNEQENARKDAEFGLKKEEAGVRMDNTRANTAQTQQNTEFKAQLQPEEIAKAKAEIVRLKAEGKSAEARAIGDGIRNDPEAVRRILNDQSMQSRAAAGASGASAAHSNAGTEKLRKDAKMREWSVSGTPEQKKQARDYFTVDDPTSRASAGKQSQVEDLIRRANPELTDAQVAQQALELSSSQKGERIIALKALVDNGTDGQRAAALEELNAIVLARKPGAAPKTGGLPPGVTEADIATTMQKHGMTREQVLARLNGGK